MHITTDSPLYQKAFEQYLRHGTPIEISLKALMTKAAETRASHTTTHYIWRTVGDNKVRASHAANEDEIFRWDDPPDTGHPGEDANCRCTAEPYVSPFLPNDPTINDPPLDPVYPELLLIPGGAIARRVGGEIIRRIGRGREKPAVPKPDEASPVDILKPNGQSIGRQGMRKEIRIVKGGEKEAKELFNKLTKGGTEVTPAGYAGRRFRMPNGDFIGYRPVAKSGSPTIDIKVQGVEFNKIHFY